MKVYTKTGDKGQTSLVGGKRVSKCCDRLESYGTVDELNSHVGLLASFIADEASSQGEKEKSSNDKMMDDDNTRTALLAFLTDIQAGLFVVGGYLATDTTEREVRPGNIVTEAMVEEIEKEIDRLQEQLPPFRYFILPGGSVAASQAHVCRTVCRRTERCILRLAECGVEIENNVLCYINRLSDYFFVLARALNMYAGIEDVVWRRS